MNTEALRNRWIQLCVRSGANALIAEREWIREIVYRYGEPWRFYHTLEHIAELLRIFDHMPKHALACPDEVELAIWFHDIVYACYDSRVSDNEEQSARVADEIMFSLFGHCDGYELCSRRVCDLIRATTHADVKQDGDVAYLLDIDLAILGARPHEYDLYAKRIAEEYTPRPYPWDVYRTERVRLVLEPFLAREHIYRTEYFRMRCEKRARQNAAREIEWLKGAVSPVRSVTPEPVRSEDYFRSVSPLGHWCENDGSEDIPWDLSIMHRDW